MKYSCRKFIKTNILKGWFVLILISSSCAFSQDENQLDGEESELAKINRELDNPLTKGWSLVFQENLSVNQGSLVDGNVIGNTFFFQPGLPIPFGKNMVFTARPVFPLITSPDFENDDVSIFD